MIDRQLLELLVCPKDHVRLRLADDRLLAKVNKAIAGGRARTVGGETAKDPLKEGLVREDGTVLYPIVDGIPVFLVEEGILLDH